MSFQQSFQRDQRKVQLEILMKTIIGKERIIETWRRVCRPADPRPLAFPDMVDDILDAEFPAKKQRLNDASP